MALVVRSATRVTAGAAGGVSAAQGRRPRRRRRGQCGPGDSHGPGRGGDEHPGGQRHQRAEHTLSMLLSLAKNIPQATASMKEGKWEKSRFLSTELASKVLGIIGLGRIGGEGGEEGQGPSNMRVLVCDPYVKRRAGPGDWAWSWCGLPELYRQADFITLHTPRTDETTNLICAATIALMKERCPDHQLRPRRDRERGPISTRRSRAARWEAPPWTSSPGSRSPTACCSRCPISSPRRTWAPPARRRSEAVAGGDCPAGDRLSAEGGHPERGQRPLGPAGRCSGSLQPYLTLGGEAGAARLPAFRRPAWPRSV